MEKEHAKTEVVEKVKKEKNNNKGLMIIIIILLLCIIGLLAAIFVPSLIEGANKEEKQSEQADVVKEIKDIDVLTELSVKIDTVLGLKETSYKQSTDGLGYNHGHQVLKQGLTDLVKQRIILRNVEWSPMNQEIWQSAKNHSFMKTIIPVYTESYVYGSTKYVSLDKVNEYSKKLFGDNLKTILNEIRECPSYLYDETNKSFYFPEPQCGGTSAEMAIGYKSKFEEYKDEAYVYVSYAFIMPDESTYLNDIYDPKFIVYKDFNLIENGSYYSAQHKDVYKTNLTQYEATVFELNKDNYKDFSEYKFTFKQDKNNNYYLAKVEQTK